jgi:sec-independent protein translocase protein TatB
VGNIGFQEIIIIAFIALLVFGPDRLPQLARQAGELVARFRRETSKSVAELKRAAELEDLDKELRSMRAELRQLGRGITGDGGSSRGPGRGASSGGDDDVARSQPPPTDPDAT